MESVDVTVISEEAVLNLLSEIVINENVTNPIYKITAGSEKGGGFNSYMTKVDIRGHNKVLSVIIKRAPKNVKMRETVPTRIYFLQEIKFYTEIFPAFKTFQNKRNIQNPFKSVPKCYKTIAEEYEELLVLENITESGFKLFKKSEQMSEAHVELVLKEYGKLHAISFAMKDQEPEKFAELTKNMTTPFSTTNVQISMYDVFFAGYDKVISLFIDNLKIHQSLLKFKDSIMAFFKTIDTYTGDYGVITHGDCWCNNMMFKYEGKDSTPTDIRLLDFQLTALTTPVIDLSYFFYITASHDMLNNLKYYLKIYHDSLRQHMLAMGSDVEKYYLFSSLLKEWKTYSKYGFLLSTVLFRIMLRDDEEVLDFTDNVNSETVYTDTFMMKSKNEDMINQRYKNLTLHMYENGFL